MVKTKKELVEFNEAFLHMEIMAGKLYKSEHNGKIDLNEVDKFILERLVYGKDIYEITEYQKILRKIKKELKEIY